MTGGGCAPPQDVVEPPPGGRAGLFSATEEAEMSRFLAGSVAELTHDQYERFWRIWVEFLRDWRGTTDVALKEVEAPLDKAKVVLLFVVYLYTVCDRREEEVTGVLSAVRHFLVAEYKQDAGFLSLEIMRKARLACRRSTDEVRDHQDAKEANTILPLCREVVLALREKLWTDTAWNYDGVLKKALWIGIGIGTDQGCRPSNLTQKDGKKAKDHTLRNSRVVFTRCDGTVVEAGPAMAGVRVDDVVSVTVKLSTHKAGVDGSSGVRVGGGAGPHFVKDLAEWAVYWASRGLGRGDDHFCRVYRESRGKTPAVVAKTITTKELRTAIKEGCVDFGLPAEFFGPKSMRKAMATDAEIQGGGGGAAEMNTRGRWSSKSNTGSEFYSHARAVRGPGGEAGAGEGLALAEARALASAAGAAKAKVAARGGGRGAKKREKAVGGPGPQGAGGV